MTDDAVQTCVACGQLSPVTSKWCEACGHDLTAASKPDCVACGEPAVGDDGYCGSCGQLQPRPRDHVEIVAGSVAAISDRGRRHHHNEDAVAVVQPTADTAVLVVCDGVSSTPGSADISQVAAIACAESLAAAVAGPEPSPDGMAVSDEALEAAVDAAQFESGAASVGMDIDELNPPSSTLVAAVVRRQADTTFVSTVWLGDSRAYWVRDDGAKQLTVDHEVGGALTRWIGLDAAEHLPQSSHHEFAAEPAADLIVCSDGMWRYFDPDFGEAADALVGRLRADGMEGVDLVAGMVAYANDRGGHDNISVAHWPSKASGDGSGSTVEPATDDVADPDPAGEQADAVPSKEFKT